MNEYILSLYVPGSKVPTKWMYPSLEDAMKLALRWEQHDNASKFDWTVSFNGEVIREMIHNPTQLPEDLFD